MVKRYPKEREEQKRQIIDLYLQCKDSLEIANAIGLSDGRVRQIVNKFKTEEINTANLIPESLQLYNVWNFQNRNTRYLG
jgi:transposase